MKQVLSAWNFHTAILSYEFLIMSDVMKGAKLSVSNVTGPCHKKHRYLHTLNTGHLEPHIMELNIVSRALVDALV